MLHNSHVAEKSSNFTCNHLAWHRGSDDFLSVTCLRMHILILVLLTIFIVSIGMGAYSCCLYLYLHVRSCTQNLDLLHNITLVHW